jgi:RHS repeat-associated protein
VVERYDYAAYGEAVSFVRIDPDTQATTNITAAQAKTVQLFGGDGEYDPSSSFYYHDKRWRQTHRFVSMDSYEGSLADPLSLHKYLYASGNPIMFDDPTGMFSDFTLGGQLIMAGAQSLLMACGLMRLGYDQVDWEYYESMKSVPFIGGTISIGEGLYNRDPWAIVRGAGSLAFDIYGGKVVGTVANCTGVAFGAAAKGMASAAANVAKVAKVLAAAGPVILKNRIAGLAAEKALVDALVKAGAKVIRRAVYVATPEGPRIVDIVVKIGNEFHGIEVKSGGGVRNIAQLAKDLWINTSGIAKMFGSSAQGELDGQILKSVVEWWVPSLPLK